jgi:hypothetical protein
VSVISVVCVCCPVAFGCCSLSTFFFSLPLPLLFPKKKKFFYFLNHLSRLSELLEHLSYRPSNQYVHKLKSQSKRYAWLKGVLWKAILVFSFVSSSFLLCDTGISCSFVRPVKERERVCISKSNQQKIRRNASSLLFFKGKHTNAKHHCDYCIVVSPVVAAAIKKVLY